MTQGPGEQSRLCPGLGLPAAVGELQRAGTVGRPPRPAAPGVAGHEVSALALWRPGPLCPFPQERGGGCFLSLLQASGHRSLPQSALGKLRARNKYSHFIVSFVHIQWCPLNYPMRT